MGKSTSKSAAKRLKPGSCLTSLSEGTAVVAVAQVGVFHLLYVQVLVQLLLGARLEAPAYAHLDSPQLEHPVKVGCTVY